jgi:ribosomal protein S18 acetylase RimI-like enzyme
MNIRPVTKDDVVFLKTMLYEAARWNPAWPRDPLEQVIEDPSIRRYHAAWGRPNDAGVLGELEGTPVGAAWYRLFAAEGPGYGFVDEQTPEISIAVARLHRRRGLGGMLLRAAMALARDAGFPTLSLSVASDNPSRLLYQRAGFEKIGEHGGSWTMLAKL